MWKVKCEACGTVWWTWPEKPKKCTVCKGTYNLHAEKVDVDAPECKDARWSRIGQLVEEHGTEEDKTAWALCRGDAAEWKMAGEGLEKKLAGVESALGMAHKELHGRMHGGVVNARFRQDVEHILGKPWQ